MKNTSYTVIGYHIDDGSFMCNHVEARSVGAAFTAAANRSPFMEIVAALPGHHMEGVTLFFPGESVVSASTVLDQPEVFDGD